MMLGLATATIVASTRIMKKPTIMAHNAFQGLAVGAAAWAPAVPAHVVDALISPPPISADPLDNGPNTRSLRRDPAANAAMAPSLSSARCRRRHGGMARAERFDGWVGG